MLYSCTAVDLDSSQARTAIKSRPYRLFLVEAWEYRRVDLFAVLAVPELNCAQAPTVFSEC